MADEEKRPKDEEQSFGGKVLKLGGRMLDAGVDAAAKQSPLAAPLQVLFNTEGYQDRQRQREMNQIQYEELKARSEQRKKDEAAGLPDARRNAELAQADATRLRAEEYKENAPTRKAQNQAARAAADAQMEADDLKHFNAETAAITKNVRSELAAAYPNMTYDEQERMIASPEVQTKIQGEYYLGQIQRMAQGDQSSVERMDRILRRNNFSLVDGPDGVKYLDYDGRALRPATKEGIAGLRQEIQDRALEEIRAHNEISSAATSGNPMRRSVADATRAIMPYNRNSASRSMKIVQSVFDGASDRELSTHACNQAMQYWNSGAPRDLKLAELGACLEDLPKLGFKTDGPIDPKNFDPNSITIVRIKDNARLTFGEFGKLMAEQDTLGRKLEERVGLVQQSAVLQAARAKGYVPAAPAAKQKAAKAASEEGTGEEVVQVPEVELQSMANLYGDALAEYPAEEYPKIYKVHQELQSLAKRRGILIQNGNQLGIDLDDEKTQAEVRALAKVENQRLKKAGFPELQDKGFWNRQLQLIEAKEDKQEAEQTREAGNKMTEAGANMMIDPRKASGKDLLIAGFANQAAGDTMGMGGYLLHDAKGKDEDAEKKRKRAKEALVGKGK